MPELYIPDINSARLDQLRSKIAPVDSFVETQESNDFSKSLTHKGRTHHFVWLPYARELRLDIGYPRLLRLATLGDPRKTSFLGDPTPTGYTDKLTPVLDMVTYHTMSTFVNPSEAEVLAQIPAQLTDLLVAYQAHCEPAALKVVYDGKTSYHAVLTRLFKRG